MAGLRNTFTCTTCLGESFKCPRVFIRPDIDRATADAVSPPSSGWPDRYATPPRGNTAASAHCSSPATAAQRCKATAAAAGRGGRRDRIDGHQRLAMRQAASGPR